MTPLPKRRALLALSAAVAMSPASSLRHSRWASGATRFHELQSYSFRDFLADFGRAYEEGSEEFTLRERLFNQHHQEMVDFESGPTRSWRMGINHFMDYTEPEKRWLLGYTGARTRRAIAVDLESSSHRAPLPSQFFAATPNTHLMNIVRDQGSCGSCWAQAATSTLEGQVEATPGIVDALAKLHNASNTSGIPKIPTLSSQTMVSCVSNPRHCGGRGGCEGATVELAYDMIQSNGGIPFAADFPYQSGLGAAPPCETNLFPQAKVTINGYRVLPTNKLRPLKEALVNTGGPVAISADASKWFMYGGGIFSDTDNGVKGMFTVNHAVTLMGYSEPHENQMGYWKVKNSWGRFWGEDGSIRLEMKANEEQHCGWDRETHVGLACDGDPDEAWVCGTCGILYDSVYPTGIRLK